MLERVVGQIQENSEFQEQGKELILALVKDGGFSTEKKHNRNYVFRRWLWLTRNRKTSNEQTLEIVIHPFGWVNKIQTLVITFFLGRALLMGSLHN